MCTYRTEKIAFKGSAKGASGWMAMSEATVYFDHPVHHPSGHALMIDFLNQTAGPSARVALEMDAATAKALALSILSTLDATPADLLE